MRLIELIGTMQADGAAINAWRVAQEFWSKGELVPKTIWQHVQANAKLIEANLAEEREDGIYVRGSSEYLSWVAERRLAAKAGGRKSAEKRSKKPKQTPTKRKQTQPSGSGSDSSSGSDSDSPVSSKPTKAGAFIVGYKSRFTSRWGVSVNVEGKDAGIAKRVAERLSYDEIEVYLDSFFSIPDAELVKKKHPIFLFEAKLNEVGVFAQSGQFHTQRQVREADSSATNAILLEKVRRGEV